MALESFCAACTYLGENADYNGKYYCSRNGEYHYASDPKCYGFCEAYSRSNSARQNMFDNSNGHKGGGCYLTTIMCSILGYDDNNYYLNTLRKFRDNVMKNNPKYIPLLVTYDAIGPTIAYELSHDKNREEIANACFNRYIITAVGAIEENKEEEAISIYRAMTETLADSYVMKRGIIDVSSFDYDMETLGHGRARKLSYNK